MNDSRNMILAIVLSAVVLFGWGALSETFFPQPAPAPAPVASTPAPQAAAPAVAHAPVARSEERRVGKECVSTCRSRWSTSHLKKHRYCYSLPDLESTNNTPTSQT